MAANLVAVAALPVQLPELPLVLPVTLPVKFPENAVAVTVPFTYNLVFGESVPIPILLLDLNIVNAGETVEELLFTAISKFPFVKYLKRNPYSISLILSGADASLLLPIPINP